MKDWDWKQVPEELGMRLKTPEQAEVFGMLRAGKSIRQISNERLVAIRNVQHMRDRIKAGLMQAGYDPENGMTMVSPESQSLKGRSALVKVMDDGSEVVAMYWNKTQAGKQDRAQAILEAIEQAAQSFRPLKEIKPRKYCMADLCTVYTVTDYHVGMYSWHDETGADWDIKIAKDVLAQAMADMMLGSPDSELAIFAQLGDLVHFDGLLALTPTSKHVLDADTRFPMIVQTAIELCIGAVELLLHKHQRVHVLMAEGNHDMASSVWLRVIMAQVFKNNPRVTVEASPFPFYAFKWGETFLGWHHGHLQKMDNLPLLFATDPKFRADYGQCKHTYIHTGHMHHQKVIDKGGIVVEQHPTLAARDAHGARGFLMANRETKAITYHKQYGERSRCTVRPVVERAA